MNSIMNHTTAEGEMLSLAHPCRIFSLAEIQYATNNFDDKLVIGQGGFGKVYKGYICGEKAGHVVAIKRLDSMSNQGELEFQAEIKMLSKLRNCHLVSLIGFCHENKERIIVYEYMTKGTLYHHLHKAVTPLSWLRRLKIAVGAAHGLDYLHTGGVIHRDVKTSNILLDENWAAMISDFGLSKLISPTNQSTSFVDASVKGTFGYLDPEYFYTSKLTRKTDVYAFGVVLFELLSGRLPVDEGNGEEYFSLVSWAQTCVKERKLDQMVDSNIKGSISTKCLTRFTQIAYRCVHRSPKQRPTMTKVVASLQDLLKLQEKSNDFAESSGDSGVLGFTLKMHKYFASNSDQSGTSSTKTLDKYMNQHEKLVTRGIKKFTYNELKLATMNFANVRFLGEGRYGEVYKGWADKIIVVKKLHYKPPSLKMFREFRHPNIVQLIGHSLDNGCHFLVYEFMNNGKLKDLLSKGALAKFPLVTKVKIVLGIARGIVFLQKAELYKPGMKICESMLDRRKILLDKDFTTKLSDYESGHNNVAEPDIDALDLVLRCNLSGYKVIFMEVLTGERIHSSRRAFEINQLFTKCGMESLYDIAKLCYEMCNEQDSESKMLTLLKEHEKLWTGGEIRGENLDR